MDDSTKDKFEGALHDVKGTVKEKGRHLTNNPSLEEERNRRKTRRKIQKKVGDVEKVFEK